MIVRKGQVPADPEAEERAGRYGAAERLRYSDAGGLTQFGAENAHQVVNRSEEPCTYLIVGTRMAREVIHYPDLGRVGYIEGGRWRLHSARDGSPLMEGKSDQERPLTRWRPGADQAPQHRPPHARCGGRPSR